MHGSLPLLLNFLWAMALVVALAVVAVRLLKRLGWGRSSPGRHVEQLDYLALGPKRGIAVVQVFDKTLCLGITDNQVTLLTELELSPQVLAEVRNGGPVPVWSETRAPGVEFGAEILRQLRKGAGHGTGR
ncbi:Flagellar protein (modular protein) [Candidatus Hydrogenisulfobacillus filiaventi]|uniref:Flagellar protein n=1 Tax=Candidatus Hydrogenisulfobacillus filiaventi TaxID=2707344 RepID=A0A6F8ZDL1_9FIRM|nr:flagellar biosynthetic protein FliO [Bacillota bacterium]CAB1128021.1 Flagellar protein (modular protein) [Candidatus Hydrogenisulfobacillus filiaventi]